jgi:MFS family permease
MLVSFSGSMMQLAAILWHVSLLVPPEKKGLALGVVGLVRVVPIVVLSLVGGVIADARDRRKLIMGTQTGMMLVAAALAVLTFRGLESVWPLYLLTALSAGFGAFDGPARQALIPNLVPREHLPNAISLNTIMFQTAAVIGPSLAGLVIASLGVGWVYLFNAISFLALIIALGLMRNANTRAEAGGSDVSFGAALEGLKFVFSDRLIRSSMLLDFFATFFSSATALLPIFAQDILKVGPTGYGWLYAAPAVGSLIVGAVLVGVVDRLENRGRILLWSVAVYGVATVLFGLSRSFWLTFACLALVGAGDAISTVLRNIIRQLATPDRLRGRMSSVNMMFFMGGPQLGELEAGLVANWFGAAVSVVSGGIACLLATIGVAASSPELRRYRKEHATLVGSVTPLDSSRRP